MTEKPHPRTMTDAEFNRAVTTAAWRTPAIKPATSSEPLDPGKMSNIEFQEAIRTRAWRNLEPK